MKRRNFIKSMAVASALPQLDLEYFGTEKGVHHIYRSEHYFNFDYIKYPNGSMRLHIYLTPNNETGINTIVNKTWKRQL